MLTALGRDPLGRARAPQPGAGPAAAAKAAALAAALFAAGCGHAAAPRRPAARTAPRPAAVHRTKPGPLQAVTVRDLGPLLPKALVGTAAATFGGRVYVLGGSGPKGFNDVVYVFSPPSAGARATVAAAGRLPQALHDGAAVADSSGVLLCGGGQSVGENTVYQVTPGGGGRLVAHLPRVLSDAAGATVGGRPYCLGGWTGRLYSDAVYDVAGAASGSKPRLAAHLPHAVRYAAALPLAGGVLVAGGKVLGDKPVADLQWVPLGGSGAPAVVGRLAAPVAYAMGASLDGTALLIGGCTAAGAPLAAIDAVTRGGSVRRVGSLPKALCYGSAAAAGGAVYVFGGQLAGGVASADVWRIAPAQPPSGG